jgi:hypothetical protein
MPVLLGLAFATSGLDALSPSAAGVVAWVNGWTAAYIAFCARLIGSLPFAEVDTSRGLAALAAVLVALSYVVARASGRVA